MCVFMNMCTCMMVHSHMCASVDRGQRYLRYHSSPFFLKTELTDWLGLAGHWTPGICVSLHLPSTGVTVTELLDFTQAQVIQTQVLGFGQQACYQQSHLPSPDIQLCYFKSTSAARCNICKTHSSLWKPLEPSTGSQRETRKWTLGITEKQ